MNSEVCCALCGGFLQVRSYVRSTGSISILHPRIIGHAYEGPPAWIRTEFIVSNGGISAFDLVDPQLRIWDNANSGMVTLDSTYKLGRSLENQCQEAGIHCKPCYAMHSECWGLFKTVALRLDIKESELPLYQCYLYKAFNAAAYEGVNLVWPHDYHLRPEEVIEYRLFSRGASYSYLEPHGIDRVGYLELQMVKPRVCSHQARTHQDILGDTTDLNIPDFLPLPLELTHKVLCFLPGTDIIALSEVKSSKTLQVPDSIWKSQFNIGAELGFLITPHIMTSDAETTWKSKYMFTKRILVENHSMAANLKRRWELFTSLVHKLRDTENCYEANIYDLESDPSIGGRTANIDRDHILVCQSLPQIPMNMNGSFLSEGVKIQASGKLGHFITTGAFVSYTGEGRLRFVSGFRFLPGGETLGLINSQDEEYIQFNTPNPNTHVIWVATSKYGIRSVVVLPAGVDCTFEKFDDVYVNRRMLKTRPGGIEITKLAITTGLSEVTSLCLNSPDFIQTVNLDRQEWFIQRYSWSPTIPPVFSKHKLEIDHYSFCGCLNYSPERARYEYASLQYILFAEQNVVRFTCWLQSNLGICGIGIFVENRDVPFILGTRTEFSVDAALDENEVITALELFMGGKDGLPVGLSVRTNRGLAFHFIVPGLPHEPRRRTLDAGKDREIVGLFAGFNTASSNIPNFQLLGLGIIASNPSTFSACKLQTIARKHPSNPQPHPWSAITDEICPRDYLLNSKMQQGYFTSTAPLASCKSFEFYIQDNHHGYRITGICVNYSKEADSPQRSPAVLGRLSGTTTKTTFEIHSDQGEYILAADVYLRKVKSYVTSESSLGVVGVVFWTSNRRKISCGKCHAEYAARVISLRISIEEEFTLQWVYAENFDYLVNAREI